MGRFHILTVEKGKGQFVEVDGEAVEVEGVQAFTRNLGPTWSPYWAVTERSSGIRIGGPAGTENEAITDAKVRVLKCGKDEMMRLCQGYIDEHGRSPSAPEPEIEIIQEPQLPGDPETCSRDTHCGHH